MNQQETGHLFETGLDRTPANFVPLLLNSGDPFELREPDDEWQSICLLYTSGTTGDQKGAVYSHRGAYLQALSNAPMFGLSADSVYLWTLPMFHCSV